jgi:hypothetical protein
MHDLHLDDVTSKGVGERHVGVDLCLVVRGYSHAPLRRLLRSRHPLTIPHYAQPHPALLIAVALGEQHEQGIELINVSSSVPKSNPHIMHTGDSPDRIWRAEPN